MVVKVHIRKGRWEGLKKETRFDANLRICSCLACVYRVLDAPKKSKQTSLLAGQEDATFYTLV